MVTVVEYPTLEQLHQGFEIDCARSADPDLRLMAAGRVKLQLVELPGGRCRKTDSETLSRMLRDRFLEDESCDREEDRPAAEPGQEPARTLDIEVLAVPPGREHWTRCGSWVMGLHLPWRDIDKALLTAFVARVVVALGLEERVAVES